MTDEGPPDNHPEQAGGDDGVGRRDDVSNNADGSDGSDSSDGDRNSADNGATEPTTNDDGVPRLAEQRDLATVYQPAEDSRLLFETVREYAGLDASIRLIDVGTGSGYVAARLHAETGVSVIGTDVNPEACQQARAAGIDAVRADVLTPFRDGVADVIVCNPPYLPTAETDTWDDWMERALSGGPDGRRIIDRFVADVGRVLRPGGSAYLLLSSLTDPAAVREHATASGLSATVVAEESHPFERLLVMKLTPVDS